MSELKACPFCGGEAEYYDDDQINNVHCKNRQCICTVFMDGSQVWNNRPIEDALRADNERMKAALEKICRWSNVYPTDTFAMSRAIDKIFRIASEGLGK